MLVHGKYFLYIVSQDSDKDTFHYGAQSIIGETLPFSFNTLTDATYTVGGTFSTQIPGWVDYFFLSDTELWVSYNYRDKVQVRYTINSDLTWTASETLTYKSVVATGDDEPYLRDILMFSEAHPSKIYTVSILEKEVAGDLKIMLEYLYHEGGSVSRVELILGREDDYRDDPYLISHPLSNKSMRSWNFKLEEANQNIVNDMFFISNQPLETEFTIEMYSVDPSQAGKFTQTNTILFND
jgi:hypothetical protein